MSSKRYPPEFEDEAIRQVLKRRHKVADVAGRLGVSSHTLYQWVKADQPNTQWVTDITYIRTG